MQVSNNYNGNGQERVSSMLTQVESTDIPRETSDVSNDLRDLLQKLNLYAMGVWEPPLQQAA